MTKKQIDHQPAIAPALRILSLGWGVQSWTLAAMAALRDCGCALCRRWGVDKLPALDYAIHADTTWEREITYQFAEEQTPWLEAHGVKVVTVSSKRAHTIVHHSQKSTGRYILIPAYTANMQGNDGQIKRQCTGSWKIEPQEKHINALLRELKIKKAPGLVEKWLGISQDEWQRAKHSNKAHVTHRYPLLEMKMTRADCLAWLSAHSLPIPGKSACVFCPLHNKRTWQDMKRAGGSDWQRAVEYDSAIRDARNDTNATKPIRLYVNAALKPLEEAVQIPEDYGMQQPDMFAPAEDDELASCDSGHCFL
jgi:hypothetical protein